MNSDMFSTDMISLSVFIVSSVAIDFPAVLRLFGKEGFFIYGKMIFLLRISNHIPAPYVEIFGYR